VAIQYKEHEFIIRSNWYRAFQLTLDTFPVFMWIPDSSVGKVTGYGPDEWGEILVGALEFFLSRRLKRLRVSTAFCQRDTRCSLYGEKEAGA
jgi:hypothetical protein